VDSARFIATIGFQKFSRFTSYIAGAAETWLQAIGRFMVAGIIDNGDSRSSKREQPVTPFSVNIGGYGIQNYT